MRPSTPKNLGTARFLPRGRQKYWQTSRLQPNFYNSIPHFFTTIEVNLPIKSKISSITKLEIRLTAHFELNLLWNWRVQGVGAREGTFLAHSLSKFSHSGERSLFRLLLTKVVVHTSQVYGLDTVT